MSQVWSEVGRSGKKWAGEDRGEQEREGREGRAEEGREGQALLHAELTICIFYISVIGSIFCHVDIIHLQFYSC